MNAHDILLFILYAVFIIATIVLAGAGMKYGLPWLKAKAAAVDWDNVANLVEAAVLAAEAKFQGSGIGPTIRKPWVVTLLTAAGVIVDDVVQAMIDARVKKMNDANLQATQLAGMPPIPTGKQPDSVEGTCEGKDGGGVPETP